MRVKSVGVCGSDVHYYKEGRIGTQVVRSPLVLGHEASGRIVELGKGVSDRRVGERVAMEPGIPCFKCRCCRAGMYNLCPDVKFFGSPPVHGVYREFAALPSILTYPVGDKVSFDEAAMLEPFSVGLHAVDLADVKPGMSAIVLGAGSVGLSAIQALFAGGALRVIATDIIPSRLKVAGRLGAEILDAREDPTEGLRDMTGGEGADVVIEAAGTPGTFYQACMVARRGATVVLVGIPSEESVELPVDRARRWGLTVKFCRRFRNTYARAVDLLLAGRVDLKCFVTHRFPIGKTVDALEMVGNYADGVIKAIVEP